MRDFPVLICFSDTGGGHRSATNALKSALETLKSEHPEAQQIRIIAQEVIESSNALNRLYVFIYNHLLRYHQNWMKYYYQYVEWSKPNDSAFGYRLYHRYIKSLLTRIQPAVVVSVHPMVNHYIARARKELGKTQEMKFVIVVTDPNGHFWRGWACQDADLTIVPNDLARDRLISLGVPSSRIRIIGMPVSPEFSQPAVVGRQEYLGNLGLDPHKLTVCLSGGSAGGGSIASIYNALAAVRKSIQVVVLCGHNAKLIAQIEEQKKLLQFPTIVLPYTESLSDLMGASDLLITKPGGLTTFEAVARRLPMAIDMITEPMPQEAGTAELLIGAGLAKPIKQPIDIVPIVESLETVPDRTQKALPAVHSLDRVDAVYDIARTIVALCAETPSVPEVGVRS